MPGMCHSPWLRLPDSPGGRRVAVTRGVRRSAPGSRATPLELFYDLVFVFAFLHVTTATAGNPTARGLVAVPGAAGPALVVLVRVRRAGQPDPHRPGHRPGDRLRHHRRRLRAGAESPEGVRRPSRWAVRSAGLRDLLLRGPGERDCDLPVDRPRGTATCVDAGSCSPCRRSWPRASSWSPGCCRSGSSTEQPSRWPACCAGSRPSAWSTGPDWRCGAPGGRCSPPGTGRSGTVRSS